MQSKEKLSDVSGTWLRTVAVVSVQYPVLRQKALDILYEIGFEEDDDLTDLCLVDVVAVPGGGPKIVREIYDFRHEHLYPCPNPNFDEEENRAVLQTILSALGVRAQRTIMSINPESVFEFVALKWDQILNQKSCGRETFDQILLAQNLVREILIKQPEISASDVIQKFEQNLQSDHYLH